MYAMRPQTGQEAIGELTFLLGAAGVHLFSEAFAVYGPVSRPAVVTDLLAVELREASPSARAHVVKGATLRCPRQTVVFLRISSVAPVAPAPRFYLFGHDEETRVEALIASSRDHHPPDTGARAGRGGLTALRRSATRLSQPGPGFRTRAGE
jgi:hypothetical protein